MGVSKYRSFVTVFSRHRHCHRYMSTKSDDSVLVQYEEVKKFIERCIVKVGVNPVHATALAENLRAADYRGHFSHGLNRLQYYVTDVNQGTTMKDGVPEVMKETAATACVDGRQLLGPVVGNFAMDLAIKKAQSAGVGWVVARGSNHYGIAGWYGMKALEKGLMGMSFTNTSPLQVPTRAKKPILGTNPICLAAPGKDGDSFVLDMATSSAALGKIELHNVKQIPIPRGWGADPQGKETHVASEVLNGGGLLPLGGSEVSSGYKGYGLAMLVEIFCGILANACWGPNIRNWKKQELVANLGQCFIAIDPEAFGSGFSERLQDFINTCRNLEPAEGEKQVLIPGDPEREHMALCDRQGGISYHVNQIKVLTELAERIAVEQIKVIGS